MFMLILITVFFLFNAAAKMTADPSASASLRIVALLALLAFSGRMLLFFIIG